MMNSTCRRGSSSAESGFAVAALIAAWLTTAALRVIFGPRPDYRMLRVDAARGETVPVSITKPINPTVVITSHAAMFQWRT